MKTISILALSAAFLAPAMFALPAVAQAQATMKEALAVSTPLADGEIKKVSKDTGKLTIKHGEIKSLDMPPMTMVFVAKDPAMLDTVAVGDRVRFAVVDEGGKMVVTEIQLAK